jgi:hypothetical protein
MSPFEIHVEVKDYYCHCYVCKKVLLALARQFVKEEPYHSWLVRIKGKTGETPALCGDCEFRNEERRSPVLGRKRMKFFRNGGRRCFGDASSLAIIGNEEVPLDKFLKAI